MKKFFLDILKLMVEQTIKSIFIILIAIVAVLFWEKQKIINSVSYEKRIEIISNERDVLMENAARFTEYWNYIYQYTLERGNKDSLKNCLSNGTYISTYNKLLRITEKTDLILGNKLITDKKLDSLHEKFAYESDDLLEKMKFCNLDEDKYLSVSRIFDNITGMYTSEITRQIK